MPAPRTLRDGSTTQDPRCDRLPAFDERSLTYRIRTALSPQQQTLVSRTWTAPRGTPVLDQGQEGQCVGYGITNELLWQPFPVKHVDGGFARDAIYWPAQRDDPWPGGSYPGATPIYEGTGVLYGIKAAAALGYYREYRWGTSELETALGVGHLGPAVIGIDWYEGMFTPNANGFIAPTGDKAGGHCILVTGVNARSGYYTLHNSWGPSWGNNGNCKIKRSDMATLLRADGECCIITQRGLPVSHG